VLSKDALSNTVVVGEESSPELDFNGLIAHDLHLIFPHTLQGKISAKIRYRQEDLVVHTLQVTD
jgi:tRNA U34 2-thiouridine synthase MnmA/TrmU